MSRCFIHSEDKIGRPSDPSVRHMMHLCKYIRVGILPRTPKNHHGMRMCHGWVGNCSRPRRSAISPISFFCAILVSGELLKDCLRPKASMPNATCGRSISIRQSRQSLELAACFRTFSIQVKGRDVADSANYRTVRYRGPTIVLRWLFPETRLACFACFVTQRRIVLCRGCQTRRLLGGHESARCSRLCSLALRNGLGIAA